MCVCVPDRTITFSFRRRHHRDSSIIIASCNSTTSNTGTALPFTQREIQSIKYSSLYPSKKRTPKPTKKNGKTTKRRAFVSLETPADSADAGSSHHRHGGLPRVHPHQQQQQQQWQERSHHQSKRQWSETAEASWPGHTSMGGGGGSQAGVQFAKDATDSAHGKFDAVRR